MNGFGGVLARIFRNPGGDMLGSIGFDLAAEKLHMLQAEKNKAGIVIKAAVSIDYPEPREKMIAAPAELKKFVKKALKSKPFKGNKIITCLPDGVNRIINVNFPCRSDQDEVSCIVKAVLERVGGNVEDYVIDFLPIRQEDKHSGNRAALAALAKRQEVISYLGLLSELGLEVEAIDIGPSSLRRLVASMNQVNDYPNVLLINFGREKTYLTVITGRRLMMDREVDFGEHLLINELGKALDLSESKAIRFLYDYGMKKEAAAQDGESAAEIVETVIEILKPLFWSFVEEVNKALIYTASETRGGSIKQIYLLGSVARYPASDKFLSQMLSIPVTVLNPFSEFASRSDSAVIADLDPIAGIARATGLALRGLYDYA